MTRRTILSAFVLTMLTVAALPSSAPAQQKSIKDQLIGTWLFVSAHDVKPDGSKVDPWGPNPKGAATYDANGRFTFMLMRGDLPKFASNSRAQATAEEGKAVAQGVIAYYGTYSVNEADKTLTFRIEGSTYPNIIGGEQKRVIASLTTIRRRAAKLPNMSPEVLAHIDAAIEMLGHDTASSVAKLESWGHAQRRVA